MTVEKIYDTASDPRIYGNRIATYSIDGTTDQDFADVLAFASLKQSHAIEAATTAFSDVVEYRQKRVEALSDALATIAEAVASISSDDRTSKSESGISTEKLAKAKSELAEWYNYTLTLASSGQITYGTATQAQNDVQTALDEENNDLNQAMNLLQSFVTRRDNAFSTAAKIIKKDDSTADSTIQSMGA